MSTFTGTENEQELRARIAELEGQVAALQDTLEVIAAGDRAIKEKIADLYKLIGIAGR